MDDFRKQGYKNGKQMRLFNKINGKQTSPITNFVLSRINKIKSGICNYMNLKSKNWSLKQLKAYWLVFVLIGIAISLEVGIKAVVHSKSIETFARPRILLIMPGTFPEYRKGRLILLLAKIRKYKKYLDSLSITDNNKYRLILQKQPYLLDSMQALESILSKTIK
jgi:hypothetical protein